MWHVAAWYAKVLRFSQKRVPVSFAFSASEAKVAELAQVQANMFPIMEVRRIRMFRLREESVPLFAVRQASGLELGNCVFLLRARFVFVLATPPLFFAHRFDQRQEFLRELFKLLASCNVHAHSQANVVHLVEK